MKNRNLMATSYLVVTAFTLIGIACFSLLEHYISNERSVYLFGLTPSHACFSILLGGLILAAAYQFPIVVRAFILLICICNLYSLAQIQSSSEQLSFFGASPYQYQTFLMTMAAGLAIYLSSCSVLARRCARTIGVGIILIGSTLLFLEFFPQLLSSASTYVFSTSTTLKLLVLSLGGAPILLSKLPQNQLEILDRRSLGLGLLCIVITCSVWYELNLQASESIQKSSKQFLDKARAEMITAQQERQQLAKQLSKPVEENRFKETSAVATNKITAYLRSNPDINIAAVLNEKLEPLVVVAINDTLGTPWLNKLLTTHGHRNWLLDSLEKTGPHLGTFNASVQGVNLSFLYLIALDDSQPSGLNLLSSFNISDMMERLLILSHRSLALDIFESDVLLYSSNNQYLFHQDIDAIVGMIDVMIPDGKILRFVTYYDRSRPEVAAFYLPIYMLMFGFIFTRLLLVNRFLSEATAERDIRLKSLNQELQASLANQKSARVLNQRITQFSLDVHCSIDKKGFICEVSPSCEKVFGYRSLELTRKNYIEFVHPEDRRNIMVAATTAFRGQPIYSLQHQFVHRDGHRLQILWSSEWSVQDEMFFCVAQDISSVIQGRIYTEIQRDILRMVSSDTSQDEIFRAICLMLEGQQVGVNCAIFVLDETDGKLHVQAAPNLPKAFINEVNGITIPSSVLLAADSLFRGEEAVFESATKSVDSCGFLKHGQLYNVNSCLPYPALSRHGHILGIVAVYRCDATPVTEAQVREVAAAAQVLAIAITRTLDRQQLINSEQRFRSLFTYNPEPVFSFDLDGRFQSANSAGRNLLGLEEEDLLGTYFPALIHHDDSERILVHFGLACDGLPQRLEIRAFNDSKQQIFLDASLLPIVIEGKIVGLFCIAMDITERKESEKQLRLFERSLDSSHNGVVIVDALALDQPLIYANPAFERITGYTKEEVIGKNCRFLQSGKLETSYREIMRLGISTHRKVHIVIKNYRKDGSLFWNDLYISPVCDKDEQVTHYIGVQHDISDERRFQDELSFNASHDELTGLPNRSVLEELLIKACQLSIKQQRKLAVLFVDLDEFKPINDSLGHHFGDQILLEVARRMLRVVRPGDTVVRMGGDEFIVLLPGLVCEEEALPVLDRLLKEISKTYTAESINLHLSASIGVTLSDGDIDKPMRLIQQADLAMYKAKQQGRNNYQWFKSDLDKKASDRMTLRSALQQALLRFEFELYYQPQVANQSGKIVGMEALLRWRHANRGYISPQEFIPVAESTGQIIAISEWVLDTACKQTRVLIDKGFDRLVTAINISPILFQRCDLFAMVECALQRHGISGNNIELEITETVMLHSPERVIEILHDLKGLGVSVAVDDFGTGYSSLSYLKSLPIDKIKIDRSFIAHVVDNPHDAAIAMGIIAIAQHLNLKVTAEGVETEAQAAFLNKNCCDELQGYYFARPMPFSELVTTLTASLSSEVY